MTVLRSRSILQSPLSLLLLLLSLFLMVSSSSSSSNSSGHDQQQDEEDWQNWDYYQLLGFHNNNTSTTIRKEVMNQLSAADIKKAYKRQARRWHPDKQMLHSNNNTKEAIAIANQRFAKIAEAYTVLSDDQQRREYNAQLLLQQQLQQQQQRQYPEGSFFSQTKTQSSTDDFWSNVVEKLNPRQLFQDLFGDDDDADNDEDHLYPHADYFSNFHNDRQRQEPIRVSQQEQVLQDTWGNQILRIIQTSEYPQMNSYQQMIRVEVVAQDFVEEWNGRRWMERPIGEPFLLKEYLKHIHRRREVSRENPLPPGNELVAGRYCARVLPGCRLVVFLRSHRDDDDDEHQRPIWQSSSPTARDVSSSCRVEFRQGHFVLVAHDGGGLFRRHQEQEVVWSSPVQPTEHSSNIFVGRLDSDGSLTSYQLVPFGGKAPSLTGAAAAPLRVFQSIIFGLETNNLRRICVWSSSPLGCFRLGRALVHVARQLIYHGNRLMDQLLDILDDTE